MKICVSYASVDLENSFFQILTRNLTGSALCLQYLQALKSWVQNILKAVEPCLL